MQTGKGSNRKKRARRRRGAYSTRRVVGWLIGCFPAGLYMMWSSKCRWHYTIKILTTVVIAALIVMIVLPQTEPPQRYVGGVQIISADDDSLGPDPDDDFERIDFYSYNVISDSVIAEPEPTPVPIYVYCNDGGKYYHNKECSYVKPTSARCTLLQALNAGYKQCKDCGAPAEY